MLLFCQDIFLKAKIGEIVFDRMFGVICTHKNVKQVKT